LFKDAQREASDRAAAAPGTLGNVIVHLFRSAALT
jgi:hypothetical protein